MAQDKTKPWPITLAIPTAVLMSLVSSIGAFAWALQDSNAAAAPMKSELPPSAADTPIGSSPPATDAERELARLLSADDDASLDLAIVNWLIAADIPQFQDYSRADYFARLDALTERVRREMAMMAPVVRARGADPETPYARCSLFCGAMIRLAFNYREQFQREDLTPAHLAALYGDADNIFLAGLLRSGRGSCVSMPLVYLVIGRRLGFPVHLVAVGRHYFVRWDEPGYRMNIETTIVDQVAMTPDDTVHLEIEGMTRDQLRGSEMRNLTPREVVGHLFFARVGYWSSQGSRFIEQQHRDLARARHLAPDDPAIQALYEDVFMQAPIAAVPESTDTRPTE